LRVAIKTIRPPLIEVGDFLLNLVKLQSSYRRSKRNRTLWFHETKPNSSRRCRFKCFWKKTKL